MVIQYACVYKSSCKPVIKGSRVESIGDARKEYKRLLEKGWKKLRYLKVIFKKKFLNKEFIDGAAKTFGFWGLGTLEQIKRGQLSYHFLFIKFIFDECK